MKPARKPLSVSDQRVEQLSNVYDQLGSIIGHPGLKAQHDDTCIICDELLALRSKVNEWLDARDTAQDETLILNLEMELEAMVSDEE